MDPNPALTQFLKSIPLFSLVEPPEMMELLRLLRPMTVAAGQMLFREDEPGHAMWVLGEGVEVSLSASARSGEAVSQRQVEIEVARAMAGETVGEMALVDEGVRSASALVVHGGPVHQIDARDFQVLRDRHPAAAYQVLRRICLDLCARLRATSERIAPPEPVPPSACAEKEGREVSADELDLHPSFAELPRTVKLALAQEVRWVEAGRGAVVFAEGEPAAAAYFLVSGEVSAMRGGRPLERMRAGAIFGLVSMIDAHLRLATCVAERPARMLRLSRRGFDALFARKNRFAFDLVDRVARQLVAHLRAANQQLSGGELAWDFEGPPGHKDVPAGS